MNHSRSSDAGAKPNNILIDLGGFRLRFQPPRSLSGSAALKNLNLEEEDEEDDEAFWLIEPPENAGELSKEVFLLIEAPEDLFSANESESTFLVYFSAVRCILVRFMGGKWRLLIAEGDELDVSLGMVEILERVPSLHLPFVSSPPPHHHPPLVVPYVPHLRSATKSSHGERLDPQSTHCKTPIARPNPSSTI